jgi:prephenate dehydrogenase
MKAKLFNKVAIVGIGLIGGSIALAIKKKRLANEIIGVSRHKKSLILAKKIGAIDKGSLGLDILSAADLLIFATPVETIINLAPLISKIISKDCVVTDVGSTKEKIVSKLEKSFPNFVGSHPLAGSEKRSIQNAQFNMFSGTQCILTPTKITNSKALNKIKALWVNLGARVIILSPKAHDKVLSFTSHLPHVAAFSLIGIIPREYLRFASNGLGDTTRIAASDPLLWVDILLSNRKNIIKNIVLLQNELSGMKEAIGKNDRIFLNKILKQAKEKRDTLG